ncbi:uncharacterized protein LOC131221559 isoform X2 [Magnolia sinica]|uniref:uncharacterized protein LOC131221559 isoform X2 n=1 Tax=Magnolia sinica TaxID=86752 RepID=UPI002659B572|nr:uncharacterized protein LOC131221559 isoform X2 [Magnolia sinica]
MKMVPIVKPLSMWAPVINGVMDMEPDDSLGEPGDAAADIDNDGAIVDMGDPAIEIASPMDDCLQRSTKARSAKWLVLCRSWPRKVYKLHGPVPVSADGWDAAAAPAPIAAPGLGVAPQPAASAYCDSC